jgi:apurinic endonuclease APN1
MLFGAHVSIAGGVFNAPANAAEIGCEVFQIFTRSPQGGPAPKLTDEILAKFKQEKKKYNMARVYIHAPYYLNLASSKKSIRSSTARIVREDLERAGLLGAKALMFHIGSARDVTQSQAEKFVIQGLNKIMDGYSGSAQLLIENSAGAGMIMGDTFEELALFINGTKRGKEIGICLDTQHSFASGYDLRDKTSVNQTLKAFNKIVGLKHLVVIHANDSMSDLGSHKDRHENIGKGKIGKKGFEIIVQHPKLKNIDMILETPYAAGEVSKDLKKLKGFRV